MDVLPDKVLKRMLVDRILNTVGGDMLLMMVFVHPCVSGRDQQTKRTTKRS